MEGGGENIVVVFDFDKTIVDVDTDNWVIDNLGFTDLFNQLLPTMPWNSVMDRMMREMQQAGVTIKDIVEVLQRVPYHPRVIPAIKAAHAAGCDLKILSDANRFFIETILKHLELQDYFSEIETNPGYVEVEDDDDEGVRVRIKPHHDFNKAPHGCNGVCPPNMCKGFVMKRLLSQEHEKTFIYLGDGTGDYCPSLKLRPSDITMPRKNFPLWDLIVSNPDTMKARVHEWTDGGDMDKLLTGLIQNNSFTRDGVRVLSQADRSASSSSFSSSSSIISEDESSDHDSLSGVHNDNYNLTTPLDSQKPIPQPQPVSH